MLGTYASKGYHQLFEKVSAKVIVTSVQNYVKLSDEEINQVFSDNESKLALTQKQKDRWLRAENSIPGHCFIG